MFFSYWLGLGQSRASMGLVSAVWGWSQRCETGQVLVLVVWGWFWIGLRCLRLAMVKSLSFCNLGYCCIGIHVGQYILGYRVIVLSLFLLGFPNLSSLLTRYHGFWYDHSVYLWAGSTLVVDQVFHYHQSMSRSLFSFNSLVRNS